MGLLRTKVLGTVDEWRALIGLATKKRGNELLSLFDAMLKGRPLLEQPSDEENSEKELCRVWDDLGLDEAEKREKGAWRLSFYSGTYNRDRWNETDALEDVVRKHSIRIYDTFPGHRRGTHPREWGIANDLYGEVWALTFSGLFVFWDEFREDRESCESPNFRGGDEARAPIPAGQWIEFQWNMRILIEFFLFMSRFVEVYDPGEAVTYEVSARPLTGRKLVTMNPRITMGYGVPEPSRAKEFHLKTTVTSEEIRTNWEQHCATAMKKFFGLFPDHRIPMDVFLRWINKFTTREYW